MVKDRVWVALKGVASPADGRDIVSAGLVRRVAACGADVTVTLALGGLDAAAQAAVQERVTAALAEVGEGQHVRLELTGRPAAAGRPGGDSPRPAGIRAILAVGSGKGGVGKSTVAVNVAVGLARSGLRVGLLDADAYGPNLPRMLGVPALPPPANGLVTPAEAHGVRLVSVGFFVKPEVALVWRGPKTDTMVRQLLQDVAWGDLDVLVVDLPPGTGDIPIALAHHGHPEGAIVVATPQEVAVDDARKAITMFRRLGVPVLGLVENMSGFVCDRCGARHDLFGRGGGRRLAEEAGVPFLAEVPFEPAVREDGDTGAPAVLRGGSPAGAALATVADAVRVRLATRLEAPVPAHAS